MRNYSTCANTKLPRPNPLLTPGTQTPESEAEELATFDRKVYLRSEEMHNHMKSQMGQMGVPFFCRPAEAPELPEVGELRRRMVELLEDMCED
jgi:hypothetical protein